MTPGHAQTFNMLSLPATSGSSGPAKTSDPKQLPKKPTKSTPVPEEPLKEIGNTPIKSPPPKKTKAVASLPDVRPTDSQNSQPSGSPSIFYRRASSDSSLAQQTRGLTYLDLAIARSGSN